MYTIFQIATKLSEYINIKLFGPSHLINRTIKYFFWPLAAMKKKITVTTEGMENSEVWKPLT